MPAAKVSTAVYAPLAPPKADSDAESSLATHPAETGHLHSRRAGRTPRRRFIELARLLCLLATVPLVIWAAFEAGELSVEGLYAFSERVFDHASPAPAAQLRGSVLAHAEIGDVVWGPCDDPNTVPGAECGYAMCVPRPSPSPLCGVRADARSAACRWTTWTRPRGRRRSRWVDTTRRVGHAKEASSSTRVGLEDLVST